MRCVWAGFWSGRLPIEAFLTSLPTRWTSGGGFFGACIEWMVSSMMSVSGRLGRDLPCRKKLIELNRLLLVEETADVSASSSAFPAKARDDLAHVLRRPCNAMACSGARRKIRVFSASPTVSAAPARRASSSLFLVGVKATYFL